MGIFILTDFIVRISCFLSNICPIFFLETCRTN
uniref:Uncharacterized protein n=1 Tax=Siphoviridae sp. ct8wU2 TaxID=2827791 RepID=A0A8S5SXT4_9CAUD|nr:MAG TPA: hypothetical protein [Siphoviridae sp. ct8wU2]